MIEMSVPVATAAVSGTTAYMGKQPTNIVTDAEGNMIFQDESNVLDTLQSRENILVTVPPPAPATAKPDSATAVSNLAKAAAAVEKDPSAKKKATTMGWGATLGAISKTTGLSKAKPITGSNTIKKALSSNLNKRIQGMPSYITVINESVQLHGTSLISNNIDFVTEYYPLTKGYSPNEVIEAKLVFAKVFAPNSGFTLENPAPPCNTQEYGTLREGLQNRLEGIRQQVKIGRQSEGLTIRIRALMDQGIHIKKLLDDLDDGNPCEEYRGDRKYGFVKLSNVDNDRLRRIIRNFSFILLQAMNPIEGYDDKMQVDPIDLVNVLDNPDFLTSDMNKFLADYQQQFTIPTVIASILSDSGSQKSVLSVMLDGEKEKFLEEIKATIATNITDDSLKKSYDSFMATQAGLSGGDFDLQIKSIIGWLVNQIRDISIKKAEAVSKIAELEGRAATLTAKIADLETVVATTVVAALPGVAPVPTGSDEKVPYATFNETLSAKHAAEEQLRELQAELEACRGEQAKQMAANEALKDRLDTMTQTVKTATADLEASVATVGMLTNKLEDKNEKIQAIAKAIQAGTNSELNREDYGEFTELLTAVEEKVGKSSSNFTDFCYLNYFVGFFFKEFSTASTAEKSRMNDKVSQNKLAQKDVEPFLNEIFNILENGKKASTDLITFIETNPQEFPQLIQSIKEKFRRFYDRHKTNMKYFIYFLFIARRYILDNKQEGLCKPSKFLDIADTGVNANTNSSRGSAEASAALGLGRRPRTAIGERELPGAKRAAVALEAKRAEAAAPQAVPGAVPGAASASGVASGALTGAVPEALTGAEASGEASGEASREGSGEASGVPVEFGVGALSPPRPATAQLATAVSARGTTPRSFSVGEGRVAAAAAVARRRAEIEAAKKAVAEAKAIAAAARGTRGVPTATPQAFGSGVRHGRLNVPGK